jgi:hypothetical protein
MPEPDVNLYQNGQLVTQRRKNPTAFELRHGTVLKPWMRRYAHWLFNCAVEPSVTEKRVKAQMLAGASLSPNVMKLLHPTRGRPDFVDYFVRISEGPLQAADAEFVSDLPYYIQTHKQATEALVTAGDFKEVATFTRPALERINPKNNAAATAAVVTVNISAKQLAGIEAEAIVVEATPIE